MCVCMGVCAANAYIYVNRNCYLLRNDCSEYAINKSGTRVIVAQIFVSFEQTKLCIEYQSNKRITTIIEQSVIP